MLVQVRVVYALRSDFNGSGGSMIQKDTPYLGQASTSSGCVVAGGVLIPAFRQNDAHSFPSSLKPSTRDDSLPNRIFFRSAIHNPYLDTFDRATSRVSQDEKGTS